MNIFVAKLNFKTTTEGLYAAFEQFGTVTTAKVIVDHETGKSKGYGFVEMENDDEGNNAINALDNSMLDGSTIVVKQARPREENPNFNRGGGGYQQKPYQSRPPRDNGYNSRRY